MKDHEIMQMLIAENIHEPLYADAVHYNEYFSKIIAISIGNYLIEMYFKIDDNS